MSVTRKIVLTSILTAVSVILDVISKMVLNMPGYGLAMFAIPLVFISIYIGPRYGIIAGFISDLVGYFLFPSGTYIPLFGLSAMMWGFIPGLILCKKKHESKLVYVIVAVIVAHLSATTINTFTLYVVISPKVAFNLLWLRLLMLPVNSVIIAIINWYLFKRTKEFES